MRFVVMFFLSFLGSTMLSAQTEVSNPEAILDAAHFRGEFDGVVVLSRNGKVIFSQARGLADKDKGLANTSATVFRLASLTKQVTALLVMQQVEAGRISLDDTAGKLMASLPATAGRVTVRQLLQHVSGLANPSDGPEDVVPPFYLRTEANAGDARLTAIGFCSALPKRDPGENFEYNNCDYIVLGALLEALTHESYPDLVRHRVIEPLGLKSWGIFTGDARNAGGVAKGYQSNGKVDLPQNPATYGAAGGLYGNALDVAKWDEALLHHTLLGSAATEVMFHADPKLYGEALGSWEYYLPGSKPSIRVIERQGDIGSTKLLNLLLPTQNASIVILANTEKADLFDTYSAKGLGFALATAVFGQRTTH